MTQKTWTVPLDDEGVMTFPEELVAAMGWDEGTVLSWNVSEDGKIILKAFTDSLSE